MKQKQRWLASSNGPDWTDIRRTMGELGFQHSASIYLEVLPDGFKHGPQLWFVVTAVSDVHSHDLEPVEEAVAGGWPNTDNATVEGLVYALLLKLDFQVTEKWYQQEAFPKP